MKHVYIFNKTSRAAEYGIRTYIGQLTEVLLLLQYKVTVVNTLSLEKKFSVNQMAGIRYIEIPIQRYMNRSLDSDKVGEIIAESMAVSLYPYINTQEDNIFHFNYTLDDNLAAALRRYYRCRIALTVHYTEWSLKMLGNKAELLRLIDKRDAGETVPPEVENIRRESRFMNTIADKVIAISRHSYSDIISIYGTDANKVHLINNGVKDKYRYLSDTNRQRRRERFSIEEYEIAVVFAGRLDEVKGVKYLIDAFKIVAKRHPNTRLFVAGDGPCMKDLMTRSSPMWSKISFMGFLCKADLYRLFSVADIGVLPSLHEEFGFVATEMMMHKLPVIVNDSTGLAELVDDGINGLKFKINQGDKHRSASVMDLVERISNLIEDASLRNHLGSNARQKFLKKYELSHFQDKMESLYSVL